MAVDPRDQEMIDLYKKALNALRTTFSKNKNSMRAGLTCSTLEIRKGSALVALEIFLSAQANRKDELDTVSALLLDALTFALKIEQDIRQRHLLGEVIKIVRGE